MNLPSGVKLEEGSGVINNLRKIPTIANKNIMVLELSVNSSDRGVARKTRIRNKKK